MAKNDPEQVVAGAGLLTAIFTKLNTAVVRKGGQLGVLHRLSTPDGDALIDQFADLIVGQNKSSDVYELVVNYDDPQWKSIDRSRYAYVGDVTVNDYPVVQTGIKPVRFRELAFDHQPVDDEVLGLMAQYNCRQPNRAEAETVIRTRYTPEQLRKNPRVGLIGPAVVRYGDLDRAYVYGDEHGVDLGWYWAQCPWGQVCRFVVVEN